MYLLCGLGNPGKKYELTRHNVGFRVLDILISNYNFELYKKNNNIEVYKGFINKTPCYTIKSLNYMNLSGQSLRDFCKFYKIEQSNIIVIHDDLDLELGKIKHKKDGGDGGHKGLMSIDSNIGKDYYRLRIGIGKPLKKELVDKYVLEKFNEKEEMFFQNLIKIISKNIKYLLKNERDLFLTKTAEKINLI